MSDDQESQETRHPIQLALGGSRMHGVLSSSAPQRPASMAAFQQFQRIVDQLTEAGHTILRSGDYAVYVVIKGRSPFVSRLVLERVPSPVGPYRVRHHMPFWEAPWDVTETAPGRIIEILLEKDFAPPTIREIRRRQSARTKQKTDARRARHRREAQALLASFGFDLEED